VNVGCARPLVEIGSDCIGEEADAAGAEDTQLATAEGGTLTMHERASVGLI
jgi:hypothetical protein